MGEIKKLLDQFGIIFEANTFLHDDPHNLQFLEDIA